jgi:hypothetical protein
LNPYYKILKLELGKSMEILPGKMVVDLDRADLSRTISNDRALLENISKGSCFWVSGGGTYLINDRYLPLVKRGDSARFNAGKYSLFTGRANTLKEIFNPDLLVRELFEELVLFSGEWTLYPINKKYQGIIDTVYQDLTDKFGLDRTRFKSFDLDIISDFDRLISLKHSRNRHEFRLNFHVNGDNDVNILFLLSTRLDISELGAMDCEYHISEEVLARHNRKIYLYDISTSRAREISARTKPNDIELTQDEMTEHLVYLVKLLRVRESDASRVGAGK